MWPSWETSGWSWPSTTAASRARPARMSDRFPLWLGGAPVAVICRGPWFQRHPAWPELRPLFDPSPYGALLSKTPCSIALGTLQEDPAWAALCEGLLDPVVGSRPGTRQPHAACVRLEGDPRLATCTPGSDRPAVAPGAGVVALTGQFSDFCRRREDVAELMLTSEGPDRRARQRPLSLARSWRPARSGSVPSLSAAAVQLEGGAPAGGHKQRRASRGDRSTTSSVSSSSTSNMRCCAKPQRKQEDDRGIGPVRPADRLLAPRRLEPSWSSFSRTT